MKPRDARMLGPSRVVERTAEGREGLSEGLGWGGPSGVRRSGQPLLRWAEGGSESPRSGLGGGPGMSTTWRRAGNNTGSGVAVLPRSQREF